MFVDYTASIQIDLENSVENSPDCIFYIHPFGYRNIFADSVTTLLPHYPINRLPDDRNLSIAAELYLGFERLQPPQDLSLLFQTAEGSADPEIDALEINRVNWSYLCGEFWIELNEGQILEDTTNNLIQPGLLRLSIPEDATSQHTYMPSDLHWIKASIDNNPRIVGDLINIFPQAIRATFLDQDNAADHLNKPLEPEQIQGFQISIPGIQELRQPYSSFGGRAIEGAHIFQTRVSERLRHKMRAINCWDYERLVLEQFPEIYKVKCLSRDEMPREVPFTGWDKTVITKQANERGNLVLVVIPDIRGKTPADPFEPKVPAATINAVESYIQSYTPSSAKITVRNPFYEQLRLRLVVRFKPGYNEGFYSRELNTAIQRFLSPWAFEDSPDIPIGGRLYASVIINFVEQLEYVDFVVRFYMKNVTLNDEFGSTDVSGLSEQNSYLEPSRPDGVWVSHPRHIIQVIINEDLRGDSLRGIGYMIVEFDFQVG